VNRRKKGRKKRKTEITGEGNNEIMERQRNKNCFFSLISGISKKKIGLNCRSMSRASVLISEDEGSTQQDRQQGGTHDNNTDRKYSHMPR
jgi:hypothetical protein